MTLLGNKNGIGQSPVEDSVGPRSPGWGQSRESCASGWLLTPERTECRGKRTKQAPRLVSEGCLQP